MGNLLIHIQEIPAQGLGFQSREPARRFPALAALEKEDIRFPEPVVASGAITPGEGLFTVQGRVEAVLELPCCRCLAHFRFNLSENFVLTYTARLPRPDHFQADEDDVIELSADDMGLALVRDGSIDLVEAIEEQVILALPMRPLCHESCKGICPECGANRNRDACQCAGSAPDPRFAVLAKLKKSGNSP